MTTLAHSHAVSLYYIDIRILILSLCGDTRIYVPAGTQVRVRRILLCGDSDIDVMDRVEDPNQPNLTATIVMLCGSIRVRSERR